MYNITREEASNILNISTRSIDRYIKSGKLRAKKEGKIVYIHKDDIDNLIPGNNKKQEIIIKKEPVNNNKESKDLVFKKDENILNIFNELKQEITKKDEIIKDMSVKVGKMEEIVKNSISMIEFKKSQFLLEESKNSIKSELDSTKKILEEKNKEIKTERKINTILIVFTVILFIFLLILWFLNI